LFGLGYGTAVAATAHSFLEWALAQLFHVYAATAKVAFSPRPGLMPSSLIDAMFSLSWQSLAMLPIF
jgi:hypothetical protein